MKTTDKRHVLKLIDQVRAVVMDEVKANRGSTFANGLSMEGFAGGYLHALDDVEGALRHGTPQDHRGYWRTAKRRASKADAR